MDHRAENWERALRNNAIAHVKAKTSKTHTPTEEEISKAIKEILPKIVRL